MRHERIGASMAIRRRIGWLAVIGPLLVISACGSTSHRVQTPTPSESAFGDIPAPPLSERDSPVVSVVSRYIAVLGGTVGEGDKRIPASDGAVFDRIDRSWTATSHTPW